MPYLGRLGARATFQLRRQVPPRRLLVLDPLGRSVLLRDCLDALSCWSSAAFCCCCGPALVLSAGRSRWAVLISSYRSTSDLVMMIHMMSYIVSPVCFQTLLVMQVSSQARGLSQPGQRPLMDTAGPHPEACTPMTWHCTKSCHEIRT